MSELEASGLGLVHGPAGIGKTTALQQMANEWSGAVSWLRLDAGDASGSRMVTLLAASLGLDDVGGESIDALIASVESRGQQPHLVVVDDLHTIVDSEASEVLERLIRYRPAGLSLLAASRFDGSRDRTHRLLASGSVLVDFEDLRFRLWEVDDLLRDHFDIAIAPTELHLLSQYTQGWAAALRLFSVAGRSVPSDARRRMILGLRTSAGMAHSYLTQEVLSRLEDDDGEFLLSCSVLEYLSAERCDALLATEGSGGRLRRLHGLGLFAYVDEVNQTYRCHDLLRSHLLSELTDTRGHSEATHLHRRAGDVAEAEGAVAEGIRYFARGDDLEAVNRLLESSGATLAASAGRWLDVLPAALVDQDPFVLLTAARRQIRFGDLGASLDFYRRAGGLFEETDMAARQCRNERRAVESWLADSVTPVVTWVDGVRLQLRGASVPASAPATAFNEALALFLAGRLEAASEEFSEVEAETEGMTSALALAAHLLSSLLGGGPDACTNPGLRRLRAAADLLNAPALDRLASAIARGDVGDADHDVIAAQALEASDFLGLGLVELVRGLSCLFNDTLHDGDGLVRAADAFVTGGYDALGDLSLLLFAALTGPRDGNGPGDQRMSPGRPLWQALSMLAQRGGVANDEQAGAARTVGAQVGALPLIEALIRTRSRWLGPPSEATSPASQGNVEAGGLVRVLGDFAVVSIVDGQLDLGLTPQHREILTLIACHDPGWTHTDNILGEFWPDKAAERAKRSMQVALSSVRRALEESGVGTIDRDGARYRVVLAEGWTLDLVELEDALEAAVTDEVELAVEAMRSVLDHYGELVADAGSAGWAVALRRSVRLRVTQRLMQVARRVHAIGDDEVAHHLAESGLLIDPTADELWSLAIATAGQARRAELTSQYQEMLSELGLDTADDAG